MRTTLITLALLAVPALAALVAAWGLWRRKWYALAPAVLVGLMALIRLPLVSDLYEQLAKFVFFVEPRNVVMAWLLVDAAAVGSLVSLWAGWSRVHWFWRLAALSGVPAALSLVAANEAVALALVVLPVIAAAAWWMRRWHDRRESAHDKTGSPGSSFRWQIRDSLLLFVVVGEVALAIRSLVAGPFYVNWEHFATLGAALVLLALAAAVEGGASSRLWRWLSAAACVGLIAAVTAIFISRDNDVLGLAYFFEQPYIQHVGSGLFVMAVLGIPATIGLVSGLYAWADRRAVIGPRSLVLPAVLLFSATALVAPLVTAGVMMLPPAFTLEKLPPSRTYDQLVAAGERIRPLVPAGRPSAKLKPELEAVAEILKQPGHVYIDVDQFAALELSRQSDLSFDALFHIVYGLEVETARAEARGDYAQSARLGELQLRLAEIMSKGGMMIHWAIARNAEQRGRSAIHEAAPHLDANEARRLLAIVRQRERQRVSPETLLAYHAYWNWKAFGWRELFFESARRLSGDGRFWISLDERRLRRMMQTELASTRLLEAHLAIELYARQHGELPESLDQLVPEQLPDVPLDPWTDRPLIYRRNGDRFVLYSTWADRQDNGGKFLTDVGPGASYDADNGYDLDLGFDRRGNPWPRDDPAIMGTPAATTGGSGAGSPTTGSAAP